MGKVRSTTDLFRLFSLGCIAWVSISSCASVGPGSLADVANPTAPSRQIVVVQTADWDSLVGTLACYERERPGDPWTRVGAATEINVGRTGLAWGRGLHGGTLGEGPVKREGDGRSPAGVFSLSAVYGYTSRDSVHFLNMPYIELTATCQCVDDVRSIYYNLVLDSLAVADADWVSRERMRPKRGEWNKWGVIVDHNMNPREPGRGSCIFLHVTEGVREPTSGCTSIEEDRIAALVKWLDAGKRPMLVQFPAREYTGVRGRWRLP